MDGITKTFIVYILVFMGIGIYRFYILKDASKIIFWQRIYSGYCLFGITLLYMVFDSN